MPHFVVLSSMDFKPFQKYITDHDGILFGHYRQMLMDFTVRNAMTQCFPFANFQSE
jgi:hypothetical protein